MRSEFINLIKLNIEHKKKFMKLKINKVNTDMIKILIKFNVIKYFKKIDENGIIFFNYSNNKSFFKIKMIQKSTKRESITYNDFKKKFLKNKQLVIISTDKGFISTQECLKKKIGGIPVLALMLNS